MGRSLVLEPGLSSKLADIAGRGAGSGLLVGTLVGDTHSVLFVAETPREESEDEVPLEQKEEAVKLDQRELDVGWLSEHAKQVARLLPGGLTVLGLFLPRPDMFLSANDGKLRKVLKAISTLDSSVPEELIILQSALSSKILDAKTSSFKPLDVRSSSRPMELVRVEGGLILDIPVALSSCDDPLSEDIKPVFDKFHSLLNSAIYIFDNKVLSENSLLGKTMEVEKKKGKSRGAKVEAEDEDEQEDAKRQEVVKVEMLVAEPALDDVVVEEETSARMKLAGKLSCRAYLPPGATVSWARVAVRADLERSLKTRLLMHSESLLGAEDEEQEDKVVHEPPRRLFVALPETSVAVADYLFPGEGTEDCLANIKEIFGVEVEEDQIEDDLEIVASPREVRPAGSSAGKAGGRRIPMVGYALYAALAAAVSAGVAYMSIGGGEDGEEA